MTDRLRALSQHVPLADRARWDAELARLDRYAHLLLRWSAVTNLTTVRDPDEVAVRHLLDSAIGLSLTLERTAPAHVLDVGSGGGLPGVVWAILSDTRVTCVDKVRKKTSFLLSLKRELRLTNLEVECADAFTLRGDWDLVTSRATLSGLAVSRLRDLAPRVAAFLGPSADAGALSTELRPWDLEMVSYEIPGYEPRWMGFAQQAG